MDQGADIIGQTKKWISEVVIGCNFCPFAAREMKMDRIRYAVEESRQPAAILEQFRKECVLLDEDPGIATSLLILPNAVPTFRAYLELVQRAEDLLRRRGYAGIYQVASFHPLYQFAGVAMGDAANYTNRSIYPMLHLLREADVSKAVAHHPDPEGIPDRNIAFSREKGALYMKLLREACMK